MTIETKYNIGDSAWIMFNNRVEKQTIIKIQTEVLGGDQWMIVTKYWLSDTNMVVDEKNIVPSKEELLKSL